MLNQQKPYPRCPNVLANVLSVFNIFIGVADAAPTADSLRGTSSVCCSFFFLSSVLRASGLDSSGFTAFKNNVGAYVKILLHIWCNYTWFAHQNGLRYFQIVRPFTVALILKSKTCQINKLTQKRLRCKQTKRKILSIQSVLVWENMHGSRNCFVLRGNVTQPNKACRCDETIASVKGSWE